jgi:hypothetical protein
MKFTMILAASCMAASLVIPTAVAQAQEAQAQESSKSNIPLQPGQEQVFFRADKLIGRSAQSPVGHNLGDIKEIVFNPEKGIYGIVQTKNDRLAALPWSLVTAVTEKAVVFNTSPQEMAGAPTFTEQQYANLNDPQFTRKIDNHFQRAMGGSSEQNASGSGVGRSSSNDDPARSSTEAKQEEPPKESGSEPDSAESNDQ